MLRTQHTVIVLLITLISYKINCASIDVDTEIGKGLREQKVKIRDETVSANSHEARSGNRGWIQDTINTPTRGYVSISSPEVPSENCSTNTTLINLSKNEEEYELVSRELENERIKILKIRKIKNECLWDKYQKRRENIRIETKTNDTKEFLLFYGTDNVWQVANKGFGERLAPGDYGEGIYFTDSFTVANNKVFDKKCPCCISKILLSRVILGKRLWDSGFRCTFAHPPKSHHSVIVSPYDADHDHYVVYRGDQTYPEYVITYKFC